MSVVTAAFSRWSSASLLELGLLCLERCIFLLQRGRLQLDLPGPLLGRGPLGIALVAGLGQLLLPRKVPRP